MTVELIVQIVCTTIVGIIGWGFLNALSNIKEAIKRNETDIRQLQTDFSDLKSDLPFVYVLREDHIRTMNTVDKHISEISAKLDRVLEKIKGGLLSG